METYFLDSNNPDSSAFDLYKSDRSKRLIILIDGSSGNRLTLRPLAQKIYHDIKEINIAAISFEGMESGKFCKPEIQLSNLKKIILMIKDLVHVDEINIVSTSMGSISSVLIAIEKNSFGVKNIILLDPADYLLNSDSSGEGETWSGNQNYPKNAKTLSTLLSKVNSDIKIHVVNFLLRNCINDNYGPDKGEDYLEGHSRLNNDMVKTFYTRTLDINKGQYIEDRRLPHAFLRDGDVNKNLEIIEQYIQII